MRKRLVVTMGLSQKVQETGMKKSKFAKIYQNSLSYKESKEIEHFIKFIMTFWKLPRKVR